MSCSRAQSTVQRRTGSCRCFGKAHTDDVTDDIQWKHWASARTTMAPGVREAIDEVGRALGPTRDDAEFVSALRAHNLGFLHAIMGLMAIKGTPLREAKWIVDASPAYADTAEDREESWRLMYEEVASDPDVQANSAAAPEQEQPDAG